MKSRVTQSALTVTLTKTELLALIAIARHGDAYLSRAQASAAAEIIGGLEKGLSELRWKQAEAKNRREANKRANDRRNTHEHHELIDGYTVIGTLSDWTDLSSNPDTRHWADMFHPDTTPREQGEIRRNAWRIHILHRDVEEDRYDFLPGDCTQSSDRAEIAQLARRIIATHGAGNLT